MVRQLTQVVGVGVESADMLVQEVFLRPLRDRKAVARYAGLTGAPDESGQKRRERGLAKGGNARVRRAMIQLSWGHLVHQPNSPLATWYRQRTADARGGTRKTMVVALARKLLIALWRLATCGIVPDGLALRAASVLPPVTSGSAVVILGMITDNEPRWWQPDSGLGLRAAA